VISKYWLNVGFALMAETDEVALIEITESESEVFFLF